MRKIIFMMSVSVDGYFEGPNHELDWQTVDDELHRRSALQRVTRIGARPVGLVYVSQSPSSVLLRRAGRTRPGT